VRELLASSELLPQGREIPETASFAAPVRLGGPVAPAAGWLIYRRDDKPLPGEMAVGSEIAVTGELAAFAALVRGEGPATFKLLLGCAGWAPGQLEGEISAGSWLPTSVRPNLVLDATVVSAWDEAYHETWARIRRRSPASAGKRSERSVKLPRSRRPTIRAAGGVGPALPVLKYISTFRSATRAAQPRAGVAGV